MSQIPAGKSFGFLQLQAWGGLLAFGLSAFRKTGTFRASISSPIEASRFWLRV